MNRDCVILEKAAGHGTLLPQCTYDREGNIEVEGSKRNATKSTGQALECKPLTKVMFDKLKRAVKQGRGCT